MTIDYETIQYRRWGIAADTQACANCIHFHQHYRKDGALIFGGHCCYPRLKPRDLINSCGYFENKNAPSGADNT